MSETFSAICDAGRIDPRLKILYSMMVAVLVIAVNKPFLLAGLLVSTLIPWIFVRPPAGYVKWYAVICGMAVLSDVFSQGFFYALEPRTPLFSIVPGLTVYREGLEYGMIQSFRVVAVMNAGLFIVATTHSSRLILAFEALRLPGNLAFVMVVSIRFLPELLAQSKNLLLAQKLRGMRISGFRSASRAFRLMLIPMIAVSLRKARQLALAAEIRAYSGRRNNAGKITMSSCDKVVALILAAVFAGFLIMSLHFRG